MGLINGFDWHQVDDVLLDMDGTLLDRHFDNFFFEEELPRRYAAKYRLDAAEAREKLFALYRSVEGELNWTDLHYWTRTLNIDVIAMTKEFDYMIGFLPMRTSSCGIYTPRESACISSRMPIWPGSPSKSRRPDWIDTSTGSWMPSRWVI